MSQFEPPPSNPYASPMHAAPPPPSSPMSGMAIVSLVLGILADVCALAGALGALVACCCPAPAVIAVPGALLLGIGGTLLGYFGMQECEKTGKQGRGIAMAGMITSGIGAIIGLLILLVVGGFYLFVILNQPPPQNF